MLKQGTVVNAVRNKWYDNNENGGLYESAIITGSTKGKCKCGSEESYKIRFYDWTTPGSEAIVCQCEVHEQT